MSVTLSLTDADADEDNDVKNLLDDNQSIAIGVGLRVKMHLYDIMLRQSQRNVEKPTIHKFLNK